MQMQCVTLNFQNKPKAALSDSNVLALTDVKHLYNYFWRLRNTHRKSYQLLSSF